MHFIWNLHSFSLLRFIILVVIFFSFEMYLELGSKQYLSRSSKVFWLSFNTIVTYYTARWINLDFRSRTGTCFCLFYEEKFFPNDPARIWHHYQTQYGFMVDWLPFPTVFHSAPVASAGEQPLLHGLTFLHCPVFVHLFVLSVWLVMGCLKTHIKPIWI